MNIAQSDDNTFAITDVTLKELAIFWHLSNRGSSTSLIDYYNKNFDPAPVTGGYNDTFTKKMPQNVRDIIRAVSFIEIDAQDHATWKVINEYLSDLDEPLECVDPLKSIPAQKHQQACDWNVTSKKASKRKATKTKKLPATDPCALDPGKPASDLYDKYFSGGESWITDQR